MRETFRFGRFPRFLLDQKQKNQEQKQIVASLVSTEKENQSENQQLLRAEGPKKLSRAQAKGRKELGDRRFLGLLFGRGGLAFR